MLGRRNLCLDLADIERLVTKRTGEEKEVEWQWCSERKREGGDKIERPVREREAEETKSRVPRRENIHRWGAME